VNRTYYYQVETAEEPPEVVITSTNNPDDPFWIMDKNIKYIPPTETFLKK
jgi:hypothetical protein